LNSLVGKYSAYDITLLLNNQVIQPKGMITITIDIPKGYNISKLALYHISEEGKITFVPFEIKNGKLQFKTNHLSVYVVVDESNSSVIKPNQPISSDEHNTLTPNNPIKPIKDTALESTNIDLSSITMSMGIIVLLIYVGVYVGLAHRRKDYHE